MGLEEKIKQHLENDPGSNEDTDIPKGYMDLMPFINKAGCECLNESDEHGFDNCLRKDMTFLESDCDEQVMDAYVKACSESQHLCLLLLPPHGFMSFLPR